MLSEKEKTDLLHKEFLFEHSRADVYIERNYKVLTVWVAALLTLGVKKEFFDTNQAVFSLFN